jgi:hypothetical protein
LWKKDSTPGGQEQKLSLYQKSTMVKTLPQYYNPCREIEWSYSKQSTFATSKQTKWLRNKKNENIVLKNTKYTKTTKNTNVLTKKSCKTIKKQKQNNNNKKNNENTKESGKKDITNNKQFDIDISNNPFITDKRAFENWYQKFYKKNIKTPTATKPLKTTNYYDCIEYLVRNL